MEGCLISGREGLHRLNGDDGVCRVEAYVSVGIAVDAKERRS